MSGLLNHDSVAITIKADAFIEMFRGVEVLRKLLRHLNVFASTVKVWMVVITVIDYYWIEIFGKDLFVSANQKTAYAICTVNGDCLAV